MQVADDRMAAEEDDPLVYTGKMRVGSGIALLEAVRQLQDDLESARHIADIPMLFQHGDADRICDVQGSRDVVARLGSLRSGSAATAASVQLIEYPGGHHDLMRERKHIADAVVRGMIQWLLDQTAGQ